MDEFKGFVGVAAFAGEAPRKSESQGAAGEFAGEFAGFHVGVGISLAILAGKVDGVSLDERTSSSTLNAIKSFALAHPTIYLPTHDPQSAIRLADRRILGTPTRVVSQEPGNKLRSVAR